jgi:ribosomal protein S18 acetylase RimI-like enzyme
MISTAVDEGQTSSSIYAVFVRSAERGQGIGAKLLSKVLDEIRNDERILRASLTVNKAQAEAVRLYEKHGFRTEREVSGVMGDGIEYVESIMSLDLRRGE